MNLYPEDGLLPGIEDRILHDEDSCAEKVLMYLNVRKIILYLLM
jgi:hypothetical protein